MINDRNVNLYIYIYIPLQDGFGGLVAPKFAGSNPTEAVEFYGR